MTFNFKPLLLSAIAASILFGCGSTSGVISTPIENIDTLPLKISKLTENQKRVWGHLDLVQDTVPGMSVDKAYAEIIKTKVFNSLKYKVIDPPKNFFLNRPKTIKMASPILSNILKRLVK